MPRDLPVREVMTTDVVLLRPEMPVEDAVRMLDERGVSGAPVVDEHERLVGLLDDTDLLVSEARLHAPTTIEILGAYLPLPGERRRFADELRHALGRTVAEVMHDDSPALAPHATCEDAATAMVERGVSRVPVVENGRVVGIVTRGDLVQAIARSQP